MSRWGNFLSGIESGLDKILQEGETEAAASKSPEKTEETSESSRTASNRQRPDRLQERLSRAVDGRKSGESPRAQSRNRSSDPVKEEANESDHRSSTEGTKAFSNRPSLEKPARISTDTKDADVAPAIVLEEPLAEPTPPTKQVTLATRDHATALDTNETGDQFYLERIEALQAKLDLFIKEATERARDNQEKAGASADATNAAKQDERFAALMAEGQKLSEKEIKHVGTIRRLHSRTNDLESSLNKARKAESDAQREIKNLRSRVESAEAAHKTAASEDEARTALVRQIDQVKKQNETQAKELASLRADLEKARANRDLRDDFDKQKQLLETERKTVADLREEIDNSRIERELSAGRQKSQLEDQKNKATQDRERAAARESELEGEVKALETRLETMRTRREEETGGTGDQQAKQLRQIEALQRQYSVSKENWGSVEASLNSRISSLEHDRDELSKKESDLRRKLREASSNSRRRDDALDSIRATNQELEDKLQSRRQLEEATINDLKAALAKAQAETQEVRDELRAAKTSLVVVPSESATPVERIDEGSIFTSNDRSQSPVIARPKSFVNAHGDFRDRRQNSALGFFPGNGAPSERPSSSRKISAASPHIPSSASFRQQSFQSLTRSSSRSAFRETGSIDDERDFSDGLRTPATPGRGFNDVLSASASNPAAGPSVQLVERMSAAVRQLESEKAATRDELDRMSLERDEARKQVVSLLKEAEAKRSLDKKVIELEKQVIETAQKYETTLELLGEKSEAVEELKADIADMKQIYRDALEKSMR